jgi:uncharacterized protein YoxC
VEIDVAEDSTTKPTIETVLERINAVGEKVAALADGMNSRFERIDIEVAQIRHDIDTVKHDINTGFRKVERKIELLNRDFLTIRGDNEDLLQRVENLESKAS